MKARLSDGETRSDRDRPPFTYSTRRRSSDQAGALAALRVGATSRMSANGTRQRMKPLRATSSARVIS